MRFTVSLAALAFLTLAAGTQTWAQSPGQEQPALKVLDAWSRATAPSQKAGGVFLTIENPGDQADRLIGVESPAAEKASLHTIIRDGDVVKMRAVEDGIEVPAKGSVVLAPGGFHVMLIGLHERLPQHGRVPVTLIFEHAGRIDINAGILSAGARGPAESRDHSQHGGTN